MAGSIQEAADEVITEIYTNSILGGVTLNADFGSWVNQVFTENLPAPGPPFNESSIGNRTVRNWKRLSLLALADLPADPNSTLADFQTVAEIVFRTLLAVRDAEARGDTIANQSASVLTVYNAIWP